MPTLDNNTSLELLLEEINDPEKDSKELRCLIAIRTLYRARVKLHDIFNPAYDLLWMKQDEVMREYIGNSDRTMC